MGCHFLLQGISPTQGSNSRLLHLLHWQWILYHWATWEVLSVYKFMLSITDQNSYIYSRLYKLVCKLLCVWVLSCSVVSTLCDPMDCSPPGSSVHGDSPDKNTGVGCYALLQGIFPTQGSNPGLPHCRQILYHLSHQGSPRILELVAYLFSREASWPRNQSGSPELQVDSLPAELPGKSYITIR